MTCGSTRGEAQGRGLSYWLLQRRLGFRIVLTIAAAVALYRTQRGDEMLPAPARALLGIAVLLANPVVRVARNGFDLLLRLGDGGASLLHAWIERATAVARLVEERYYTAVAVVVVIVLLYSVGR